MQSQLQYVAQPSRLCRLPEGATPATHYCSSLGLPSKQSGTADRGVSSCRYTTPLPLLLTPPLSSARPSSLLRLTTLSSRQHSTPPLDLHVLCTIVHINDGSLHPVSAYVHQHRNSSFALGQAACGERHHAELVYALTRLEPAPATTWVLMTHVWLMAHGLWLMPHGLWLLAHSLWLTAYGLWLMAHEVRFHILVYLTSHGYALSFLPCSGVVYQADTACLAHNNEVGSLAAGWL